MPEEPDTFSSKSQLLAKQLAVKAAWRKAQAALPMSEKVKVLEKLRERSEQFEQVRERRRSQRKPIQ
jgi:hypothetical protein